MNIVVTAESPTINACVDSRFGRGKYFLLVNTETMETTALANPAESAARGAGTQAAQFVANHNVDAVVSGDFGPNARRVLEAAHIGMYLFGDVKTVNEAIDKYIEGRLQSM